MLFIYPHSTIPEYVRGSYQTIWTKDGKLVHGFWKNKPVDFYPSQDLISYPLCPGKEWEAPYRWEKTLSGVGVVRGKVVRWEKVTVAGGTFNALRVEVQVSWELRVEGADAGTYELTYWVAPGIWYPIRWETPRGDIELIRYNNTNNKR